MPVKKQRRTTPKKKARPPANPVMIFTVKSGSSNATGSSKATRPPKAIKELVLPAWYTDLYKPSPRSFRNTIHIKTKLKKDKRIEEKNDKK